MIKNNTLVSTLKAIQADINVAQDIIARSKNSRARPPVIGSGEISLVLDEITKAGKAHRVDFISMQPQAVRKLENVPCSVLPVSLGVESRYKDMALFLGAVIRLENSAVRVSDLKMQADEDILPVIRSSVTLEIFINSDTHYFTDEPNG